VLKDSAQAMHKVLLGNDFQFRWVLNGDVACFNYIAPTTGWAAIGFSKSGGMLDSDVVIGYIIDNTSFVADYSIKSTKRRGCPNGKFCLHC
jgi:hypothetical protein